MYLFSIPSYNYKCEFTLRTLKLRLGHSVLTTVTECDAVPYKKLCK